MTIVRSFPGESSARSDRSVVILESDSLFLRVPSRVNFPRGSNSVSFVVRTRAPRAAIRASVTARYNGGTKQARVDILPQDALESLTLASRKPVAGGESVVATVRLLAPSRRGASVFLSSSDSDAIMLPRSRRATSR